MQLTRELLLAYPGLHRLDGLCHLRIYEDPDQLPVVIAGADGPVEDRFREPRWETIDDIEELVACTVAVWAPGFYTAGAIAGEEGERLRSLLAENANRVGEGDPEHVSQQPT